MLWAHPSCGQAKPVRRLSPDRDLWPGWSPDLQHQRPQARQRQLQQARHGSRRQSRQQQPRQLPRRHRLCSRLLQASLLQLLRARPRCHPLRRQLLRRQMLPNRLQSASLLQLLPARPHFQRQPRQQQGSQQQGRQQLRSWQL